MLSCCYVKLCLFHEDDMAYLRSNEKNNILFICCNYNNITFGYFMTVYCDVIV